MGKHKEKNSERKHDDDNEDADDVENKAKEEKRKNKKRKRKERKEEEDPEQQQQQVKEKVDDADESNDHDRKKRKKDKKKKKLEQEESSTLNNDKKDKKKKKEKKRKKEKQPASDASSCSSDNEESNANSNAKDDNNNTSTTRIVASSALDFYDETVKQTKLAQRTTHTNISLLLFYQYVEPPWDESTYDKMLKELNKLGKRLSLTGRMRVAKEGLNCTLTASHDHIMEYCRTLQTLRPKDFKTTEFKVTQDLPQPQRFKELKVMSVVELVNYGLEGAKAPPIQKFHGTHLEPKEYHEKLAQENTVIIDVRNHYEANIGRFVPPTTGESNSNSQTDTSSKKEPPKWLDPKMRKSTEFPAWLDRPETKEQMKGKQVLMYCTGVLLLLHLHLD
jgi:chemotaxis protein histidine kinase CheA